MREDLQDLLATAVERCRAEGRDDLECKLLEILDALEQSKPNGSGSMVASDPYSLQLGARKN